MRYYKRVNSNGETTTVESYSHDLKIEGAIEITKQEFDDFIKTLPIPLYPPTRDLAKEIDQIKLEISGMIKK